MTYEEDDWNESHPVPATAIGIAAILGGLYFGVPLLPHLPALYVMGGAIGAAALIWVIGYIVTIRHASSNAKLLSFLLLIGAAIVGSYYSTTYLAEQRMRADLRTLGEMQMGPSGFPTFPAGAENRGPISKLYVGFVREMVDGQHALDVELQKAGVPLLSDATALRANPALLSNCWKIASIKTMAHDAMERRRAMFRSLIKTIDDTDYPADFKRGVRASMSSDRTDENLVRMDQLQGEIFDAVQGGCTVLARRHWVAQGPVFMFSSSADLNAFSDFGQRQNQAAAEFQRIQADSLMRMREGQSAIRDAIGAAPR